MGKNRIFFRSLDTRDLLVAGVQAGVPGYSVNLLLFTYWYFSSGHPRFTGRWCPNLNLVKISLSLSRALRIHESQWFRMGSLIPPEVSYENTDSNTKSKVVELDEDGNELEELPRLPPKRLLSRYMSMPVEDEEQTGSLIPSPGVEEEQICLSPGTPDDIDGGYLEPQTGHLYEEIKEVKRTVEVTPTGSRIFTVEERTRKIPLMRRLTSRMSRKNTIDSDNENIKCTCSKKNLLLGCNFYCNFTFIGDSHCGSNRGHSKQEVRT